MMNGHTKNEALKKINEYNNNNKIKELNDRIIKNIENKVAKETWLHPYSIYQEEYKKHLESNNKQIIEYLENKMRQTYPDYKKRQNKALSEELKNMKIDF